MNQEELEKKIEEILCKDMAWGNRTGRAIYLDIEKNLLKLFRQTISEVLGEANLGRQVFLEPDPREGQKFIVKGWNRYHEILKRKKQEIKKKWGIDG